jgi:deoxyribose-phosphate aldolase
MMKQAFRRCRSEPMTGQGWLPSLICHELSMITAHSTSRPTSVELTADGIVSTFDHAILHPTLTDAQMRQQIATLAVYPLASVCIKPYAVSLAVDAISGTRIAAVGAVVGFPHGSSLPRIKAAEAQAALADGATDIDMVVNNGKVIGGDWDYVSQDIAEVLRVVRQKDGALLKVIFETDFLTDDQAKIRLCKVCGELGVDYVKTSTGFGYVKQASGDFNYRGATDHDVKLMREFSPAAVGVKPSGGVKSLDDVLRMIGFGATRFGTTSTAAIHQQALERFGK